MRVDSREEEESDDASPSSPPSPNGVQRFYIDEGRTAEIDMEFAANPAPRNDQARDFFEYENNLLLDIVVLGILIFFV